MDELQTRRSVVRIPYHVLKKPLVSKETAVFYHIPPFIIGRQIALPALYKL